MKAASLPRRSFSAFLAAASSCASRLLLAFSLLRQRRFKVHSPSLRVLSWSRVTSAAVGGGACRAAASESKKEKSTGATTSSWPSSPSSILSDATKACAEGAATAPLRLGRHLTGVDAGRIQVRGATLHRHIVIRPKPRGENALQSGLPGSLPRGLPGGLSALLLGIQLLPLVALSLIRLGCQRPLLNKGAAKVGKHGSVFWPVRLRRLLVRLRMLLVRLRMLLVAWLQRVALSLQGAFAPLHHRAAEKTNVLVQLSILRRVSEVPAQKRRDRRQTPVGLVRHQRWTLFGEPVVAHVVVGQVQMNETRCTRQCSCQLDGAVLSDEIPPELQGPERSAAAHQFGQGVHAVSRVPQAHATMRQSGTEILDAEGAQEPILPQAERSKLRVQAQCTSKMLCSSSCDQVPTKQDLVEASVLAKRFSEKGGAVVADAALDDAERPELLGPA
eukprot:scaffold2368_cov248-Pinguiococcus_pyrenoidosus.AAC.3